MILCVYALIRPARPLRMLTGIKGEPLRAIRVDGVVAVVGEFRSRPAASTTNLRRYAAVVEAIASRASSILPARFGTTFDDLAELASVLRSRGPTVRERLRAVRGRAQMTIRFLGSDAGDDSHRDQTPVTSRTGVRPRNNATQGTQYLQQRLALTRQAREVPELVCVRPAIQRFVKEERVERRRGIVTVHHLVPRTTVGRYRSILGRAAEDTGLRLAVSGPWAPYAFADNW